MKFWHWIFVALVAYEGFVGALEIAASNGAINANLGSVPTVGSLYPAYAGAIDLATAATIYFLFLHGTVKELL